MRKIKQIPPVKLIVGMISADLKIFEKAKKFLEKKFGKVDLESGIYPFDKTDYYEKEMGKNLLRKFLSFENLIRPEEITEIKIFTNRLEKGFSKESKRLVNLDPGYITDSKLVLATVKNYYHRIYLKKGIFAEVTLYFKAGSFRYFDSTYPDYRTLAYISFFNRVREIYRKQIRERKILR